MSTVIISGGSGLLGVNWAIRRRSSDDIHILLNDRMIQIEGVTCHKVDLSCLVKVREIINKIKPDLIKIEYKYSYALFVIILLSSLIIIYKNYDSTYFSRMNGPFAKAHKKIKHLNKKKDKENYIQSILILTDAFNKTFNKNINNSNLHEFTKNNRNYQPIEDEIKIFVEVSSTEIYSSKTYFNKTRFNDIYNFSKLLRTIERKI